MATSRVSRPIAGLLLLVVAGCADGTVTPTTTSAVTTTVAITTSVAETTTTSITEAPGDKIALAAPSPMGAAWTELFTLAYGDAPEHLGTSLGGDGEGIMWGPDYGTQMPDGTWWFLDAAHLRLAHFDEAGGYLGEVVLPEQYLAQGQYFQYQRPHALADGTLGLSSSTPGAPGLLLLTPDGAISLVPLASYVGIHANDGRYLYGFDETVGSVRVDPSSGTIEPVTDFAGQGGEQFSITVGEGTLHITRPGVELDLGVESAADPEVAVHPMVEAAMGADGALSILVIGLVEETPGDISTVIGFFRVDREGQITPVAAVREPSSPSDPGTGDHLGIRHGSDRPWLMFIDGDAVRVYGWAG